MRAGAYDFVLARPSDYPARGVRDYGYRLVVTTQPEGHVVFIVGKDSPLKTIADVRGKHLALPEQAAYMGRVASATLRDQGIDVKAEKASFHRDQEVIGYAVENGLAEVGAVASYSRVAREWEKKGGRFLFRGPSKPFMPLVAGKALTEQDVAKLRAALLAMDKSEDGKAILKRVGVKGFEQRDTQDLLDLLKWLGY
jgi:ABC-type phosphate/phosphonate transport system substrate-binding protein